MTIKIMFPWQLTLYQSPPTYFNLLVIFSTKNIKWCQKLKLDHTHESPLANVKMECHRCPEKPLILGRSGTQYVAMVTKLLSLYCGAHSEESYCKESNISDTNWLRYLRSSYLTKVWLSV